MSEEALLGIESELHNLNLNIMELTKVLKGMNSPKTDDDVKVATDNLAEVLFGGILSGLENNNE